MKVQPLAKHIGSTQSLALLRIGECNGPTVAVVQPSKLLVKGAACGWSDVELIKRVAAGGKAKRIAITDEPARYGLMAA